MNIIWKEVDNFEKQYLISNTGKLKGLPTKNIKSERLIKPDVSRTGYNSNHLFKLEEKNVYKKKNVYIHRLVAIAFIPNPENKPCVNHINGIKTDNRVENLEWATFSENSQHAVNTGLDKSRGLTNYQSIFEEDDIYDIRLIRKLKKWPYSKIAVIYNVSRQTIYKIVNQITYKEPLTL